MSRDRRRRSLTVAAVAAGLAVAALVALLLLLATQGRPFDSTADLSAGALVFRTGTDPSGEPIPTIGGMGGMMVGRGCAGCHGLDGQGRSTHMFSAPDITYDNLTDPRGMLEPDGSRHETFSDEEIKRAVIDGLDPEGEELDWVMPRWQLTDSQWQELLDYLTTL